MQVLESPDGQWRVEARKDGLTLLWRAAERRAWTAMLTGAQMDQVVAFLVERGVDPGGLRPVGA